MSANEFANALSVFIKKKERHEVARSEALALTKALTKALTDSIAET